VEKKLLLVGMIDGHEAFEFMNEVINQLTKRAIDITYIDHRRVRFITIHTEVWFIWSDLHMRNLQGVRANGIFGHRVTDEMLARATNDAVISNRDRIGLVDYICMVDRDATRCEDNRPKMYITTAGSQASEFHKRFMNSVYGAHPENRYFVDLNGRQPEKVEFLWGRQNGKTQACIDYMTKLIERGELTMTQAENMYIRKDIDGAARLAAAMQEVRDRIKSRQKKLPDIKNVHFSGPVTAVIWEDKTKTIVRCKDGEVPDYEKGLAMAIAKKALGTNKSGSNYYDIFKKWLPKPEVEEEKV
jgi:hypothetical protein